MKKALPIFLKFSCRQRSEVPTLDAAFVRAPAVLACTPKWNMYPEAPNSPK